LLTGFKETGKLVYGAKEAFLKKILIFQEAIQLQRVNLLKMEGNIGKPTFSIREAISF
jgi:hypothetical protein